MSLDARAEEANRKYGGGELEVGTHSFDPDYRTSLARALLVCEELRKRLEHPYPTRLPDDLDLQLRGEMAEWALLLAEGARPL